MSHMTSYICLKLLLLAFYKKKTSFIGACEKRLWRNMIETQNDYVFLLLFEFSWWRTIE